jgi:ubiquinone/menaquinone biosynthesis C-methylase UbiE
MCNVCNSKLIKYQDKIKCAQCSKEYPLVEGVGVFVDFKSLSDHDKNQIKYFKDEDITGGFTHQLENWQSRYVERFLENIPDVKDKVIFDCGSGSGYMAIELAKEGAIVIALDLTLRSCIRLNKIAEDLGLSDNIVVICASAESLPVRSNIADIFISNAVLEHLPNEHDAIKEINRVSSKKAYLMIAVPIYYRYLNPLLLLPNMLHDRMIGHLRRYDQSSLKLKFYGWKNTETYYTGHTFKALFVLINKIYSIVSENFIEVIDKRKQHKKFFSSNIITFFIRK